MKRPDIRQLRRLPQRLLGLFPATKADAEMDREIAAHLALMEEDMIQRGASPAEARRLARLRLGGVEQTREMHRQQRGLPFLESLIADLRFGWRQLMKRKVTTAAVVLSLGLAMGAVLASFRLVDALFLRPLPIAHPERLYLVQYSGMDEAGKPYTNDVGSYPQLEAMRAAAKGQAEVAAVSYVGRNDVSWAGASEVERVSAQYVSGSMFAAFGLQPALGRLLTTEDDRAPGEGPYVVLSYRYWQRRFGGDAGVIGKSLHTRNAVFQVVGVGPKGFTGTQPGQMTDLFLPLTMDSLAINAHAHWLRTFVLAGEGVPLKPLTDRLVAADRAGQTESVQEMLKEMPTLSTLGERYLNQTVTLEKASQGVSTLRANYGESLLALSVLAGMVLLIACLNVANLMAGLAAARAREMAVRVSLGAGRGRLVRLVMLESAMAGIAAAALGTLFAWWAAPFVLGRLGPSGSPIRLALDADVPVTLFGGALAVAVTMLFGLTPALRSARVHPSSALKGGADQPVRMRWMHGMVGVQAAFCMVVLFVAGLFVISFAGLAWKPLGFAAEQLVVMSVSAQSDEPLAAWQQRMEQMRAVPGVESVSMSNVSMLSGGWTARQIEVNGEGAVHPPVYEVHIWPGWLETMQIQLLAGRDLRENDLAPGAAVVNEAFAQEYFHGEDPLGRRFAGAGPSGPDGPPRFEIVGLVHDAAYNDLHQPVQPTIYLPMRTQVKPGEIARLRAGELTIRIGRDPEAMLGPLRQAAGKMAGIKTTSVLTQMELVRNQLVRERLLAMLAAFFAAVALLLAAVGLYGVLHYTVVQRQREIGIRIALGAAAGNIARIVTARVMAIVILGIGLGLTGGVAAVRLIQSLLYGVKGTEPAMLLLPGASLLLAAACAVLPAVLRAVRIDPVKMLRAE